MSFDRRKDEVNHRSSEVLSILVCFLVIIVLIVWGFSLPTPPNPNQQVKNYAKILGYSIWQLELNKTADPLKKPIKVARGLASEDGAETGMISQDPWGNPYLYAMKRDQQLLFIWSLGPDGKDESQMAIPSFRGDDIGYILDLKMKQ